MNKKAKVRIINALQAEFNMEPKQYYVIKRSIIRYGKMHKFNETTILKMLHDSISSGRRWIAMLEDEKSRKEIIDAEQSGLLCGNKNA